MAKPRIFVSSTCYDLKHIRSSLENFIESLGFEPILSEKGDIPYAHDRPLDESCYREVLTSDVFVTILGGRYGSERSATRSGLSRTFFEAYDSVTREEYKAAVKQDIPIYVFVEKSVYADYEVYLKNKENESVVYPHVDSVNTLKLIEEIISQPRNNPLQRFEKYSEIEDWLRVQWAGLFQELLRKRTEQSRIGSLESQVKELAAINQTLKNYIEEIFKKLDPANSGEIIKAEDLRLEKESQKLRFAETTFVRHMISSHGMNPEELYVAFKNASTINELHTLLNKIATTKPKCSAFEFLPMATTAFNDINDGREALNLPPLPRPKLSKLSKKATEQVDPDQSDN